MIRKVHRPRWPITALIAAARERDGLEEKLLAEQAKGHWEGQHELEMTRVRERNLLAQRDELAGMEGVAAEHD
jgi:hypothetical protein